MDAVASPKGQALAGNLKGLLASLLAGAILGGTSFAVGLRTSDAVQSTQVQNLRDEVKNLQETKVGKAEFAEFRSSVDDLKTETRLLRQELAATREALAANGRRR